MDRAAQLADEWNAGLTALNVFDPSALPDQVLAWASGAGEDKLLDMARRQLASDLKSVQVDAQLRVDRGGDTAEAIQRAAAETQSGLVVTGVSRNETLGQFLLGSTVETLARSLVQPLLVVHNRVHEPYRKIVVATDFSEPSRRALETAARYFPSRDLIVYHAQVPMLTGSTDAGTSTDSAEAECARFLSATTLPAGAKHRTLVESGNVEVTLPHFVRKHEIDLVVIGNIGRSGIMSLLLGSTAAKLLDWLPCDTLLVPNR
jgi:nucleotide-binding universal stress UspA family protein